MSDAGNWFAVGHVTNERARTGCTVIRFDRLSPTSVDVRGGAPGTRETDLLGPGRLVGAADAILLTGGSALGLDAANGVVRWLREQGRGFATAAGPVPIVPAAVIFDLANGEALPPDDDDGYRAVAAAQVGSTHTGQIGAGTGATVAKLGGPGAPGGLGIGSERIADVDVTAIVVLNAVGEVREPWSGRWLARAAETSADGAAGRAAIIAGAAAAPRGGENTTIGAVLVSEPCDRVTLARCCASAHAALARCVVPAHTIFDGDTFFASAPAEAVTSAGRAFALACATEVAVERAIAAVFPSVGG